MNGTQSQRDLTVAEKDPEPVNRLYITSDSLDHIFFEAQCSVYTVSQKNRQLNNEFRHG